MKKSSKLFIFAIALFFGLTGMVSAKKIPLNEIGKKAQEIGAEAGYSVDEIYVIGEYAFTNNHILTTQDFMMAATTFNRVSDGYHYVLGSESNASEDSEYQKMNAYAFTVGEDGSLTPADNLVGAGKNEFNEFEIKYIDYNYIALDAKYEVELAEKYDAYGFDGNGADLAINPTTDPATGIVTGIVTGLIKIDGTLNSNVFSGDELTGYYLAYDLKITGYTENTTIKITGLHENNYTDSSFSSDKATDGSGVTTIHFLASLNPTLDEKRQIVIEVDLDGEGNVYEPTKYVIDWSKADIQTTSTATVGNNIPTDDIKDNEDRFGYVKDDRNTYAVNSEGTAMTGRVFKQTLTKDSFGEGNSTGYFVTLNVKPEYVTEDIVITYTIGGKEYHAYYADLTEDSLTLILKLDETTPTSNVKIKIDSDGAKDVYLESEEYTIDLSALEYVVDSEDEVIKSVSQLTENAFYSSSYKNGIITINMDVTNFTKPSDIQGTGIIKGIKEALKTGDYSKIVLTYGKETPIEITPEDLNTPTGVSEKFNGFINKMVAGEVASLSGNEFTITFVTKNTIKDISKFDGVYTVHFNITTNSETDIKNYLGKLKIQDLFTTKYNKGVITVTLNDTTTDLSEIHDTDVIDALKPIINSGRYATITLKYGRKSYIITDEASATTKVLELFGDMVSENDLTTIAGESFTIEFQTMGSDLEDKSDYDLYEVEFEIATNTYNRVTKAFEGVKGNDFFTVQPVTDEAGKVTAYNILISDAIEDLNDVSDTLLMQQLAAVLGTKLYSEIKIGDITTITLESLNPELTREVKDSIIEYLEAKIGEGDITALKGETINVVLTLANGVVDETTDEAGNFEFTINLDVKTVVDDTTEITEESTAFENNYYNKVEKDPAKGTVNGDMYTLPYESFSEDDKNAFYMEIGEYTGTEENPEVLVINGVSIKAETRTTFSVGNDAFLEAPVWVIEDGKLYVSVAYMNVSAMPGTNTLISVGGQNFDVKLFASDLSSNVLELDSVTPNTDNAKVDIKKVTDGVYNVNIKYTQYNIPFLFHIKLGGEEIMGSELKTYTLDLNTGAMGFTPGETNAAYGCYFPWVTLDDSDNTVKENGNAMNWKVKVAIPGKGVITLNITVQAVTSLGD